VIYDSAHWRKRADEVRIIAGNTQDVQAKTTMLRIAEDYDLVVGCCVTIVPLRPSSALHRAVDPGRPYGLPAVPQTSAGGHALVRSRAHPAPF